MVAPGEILGGKYQIERTLGRGGMGVVLAAKHLHLDQRVAIKLLNDEHVGQPMIVERFLREARASVRLRSEHVGRILDAGRFDDGAPYMVMEYLEGHDLAAELRLVHRLPIATAVEFVLQACEALAEAHQAGIIHRDLKPANMFVTRDADGATLIKVLDFGISKVSDDPASDLTRTKAVMGSPPYMSPEQLRASRNVDARSDVWSLGVVLYQLVAGRLPFVGETLTDLALRISTDPPEPLAIDVPGLEATIGRCFAKAPAERYANVAELAVALAPFGDLRTAERIERIRRRMPVAIVPESGPHLPVPAPETDLHPTTLSGASGTIASRGGMPRRRFALIGGVAVVVSALAMGAFVTFRSDKTSTGAAIVPATPAVAPPRPEPAPPPPAAVPQPAPPPPAAVPQPAPAAASTHPVAPPAAATPAPKPAPKAPPTVRRPQRPPARPVEDLTKSQY